MKLGKKATIALSFIAGACLFFTTALADMTLGTGYDRLKEAAKHTSARMESGLDSYTLESSLSAKVDGIVMYESTDLMKVDAVNRTAETLKEHTRYNEKKYSWYTYSDETMYAYKSGEDEQFYVTERTRRDWSPYSDPFRDEFASDMERIVDALVGNLKDYVMVEEAANGGKVYSGSLSQAQVPTLVNAVLSFLFRQTSYDWFRGSDDHLQLTEDIHVSRVSGRAEEDETGLLRNVTGEIVLNGLDKNGQRHELVVKLGILLRDIGSTTITKPDLTNAIVERTSTEHQFAEKHIGVYRTNIIIEKPDRFIKIGERTLEITAVTDKSVIGKYYETINPEYQELYEYEPLSFEFVSEQRDWSTVISYTDAEGVTYHMEISPSNPGQIFVYPYATMDKDGVYAWQLVNRFDSAFIRVFE